MKPKKFMASVLALAVMLSLCGCNDETTKDTDDDEIVSENKDKDKDKDSETENENVSESEDETFDEASMWDIIPEIPETDASAFEYSYDSELGGMVVTDYLLQSPKVRIPDKLEGEQVVKVDFSNLNKELVELVVPETVKSYYLSEACIPEYMNAPCGIYGVKSLAKLKGVYIGNFGETELNKETFKDYTNLESVHLPNSLTIINERTFENCISLKSLIIPNSVTTISEDVFDGCTNLTNITYKGKTYDYEHINELYDVINRFKNGLRIEDGVLTGASRKLTEVVIPDGVTSIGDYAFNNYTSLTSVTIPNSVTLIGYKAFYECTSLTSIDIPDSVTSIGMYAFYDCTSLTSIDIPDSVTLIDDCAFWDCTSLTSVTIPNSVTSIGMLAFSDCRSLTSVTIPDSVTLIDDSAFNHCTSLTSAIYKGKTYDYEHIKDLYNAINR